MKNLKTLSIAILSGAIIFASCKKDEQIIDPIITPNKTFAMKSFFVDNEKSMTQYFNESSSGYVYVIGNKGTKIGFLGSCLETATGGAVTGNIRVELIEIMDKESMVLTNKSTNGIMANGDVSTLLSGGQIKLNITQNGNQLKFKAGCQYGVAVPTDYTNGPDNQMNKFTGNVNTETNAIKWEDEDTAAINARADSAVSSGFSYTWSDSTFGWTNIDKFYNDTRPKTTIHVDLPTGFDNDNTSVYISYDGQPLALANFDVYDNATELFTEHYGLIPIGLDVHFVIVGKKDNQLYSAIIGKSVVSNHNELITTMTPTTKAQLTADVIALP